MEHPHHICTGLFSYRGESQLWWRRRRGRDSLNEARLMSNILYVLIPAREEVGRERMAVLKAMMNATRFLPRKAIKKNSFQRGQFQANSNSRNPSQAIPSHFCFGFFVHSINRHPHNYMKRPLCHETPCQQHMTIHNPARLPGLSEKLTFSVWIETLYQLS